MVRMSGGGATTFQAPGHPEYRADQHGVVNIPESLAPHAEALGFRRVVEVEEGAAAPAPKSEADELRGRVAVLETENAQLRAELDARVAQLELVAQTSAADEKRGLDMAGDLTKVEAPEVPADPAPVLAEEFTGEPEADPLALEKVQEAGERAALSPEAQASYDEARSAGMSHGEALELVRGA
jgi:hypothetical protein